MFDIVETTLATAVAQNGTFTVAYPAGRGAGSYAGGHAHKMFALMTLFEAPTGLTVSFGASEITVTYKGATSLAAGTKVSLEFDRLGAEPPVLSSTIAGIAFLSPVYINLGAPLVLDADGILNDAVATTTPSTITTFLKSVMDVPRNVTAVGTAGSDHVITVTGKDVHGATVVESLTLSGTNPIAGKKAFKEITSVHVAAGADGDTFDMGYGDVLGLPVFLPAAGLVVRELQDGALATAGTTVAGVSATPTATTGDVRGTYDPNAAADGSKVFTLLAFLEDPSYKGLPQYAG